MVKFEYFNPNEKYNKELEGGGNDCFIRALMIVSGKSWYECFDLAVDYARELRAMPDTIDVVNFVLEDHYDMKYMEPLEAYTVAGFMKDHPKGVYVLDLPYHVSVVKDGVLYDTDNISRRKITGYWFK